MEGRSLTGQERSSRRATGPDDAKGWVQLKCEGEYRFADGSLIVLAIDSSYDPKTLDANSAATFVRGKGRFEGITGKATGSGLQGKMQWTGSYSLPTRK